MTSVQGKKEGTGNTEKERQTILKQMKVRTKLKTDKSWIHQGSEEEKDEVTSPISPQLKALEGRKLLWSPTPELEPDSRSGIFTAKEIITSSPSPPVQSSNNRFSYTSTEMDKSSSIASKPSPPHSSTGNKPTTSYIIRGQPVNAVSQVKSPVSFNGYQKSQIQARTASLPRVPTATGYKMSTEEYKKLAPYNVKNRSGDLSDDETPFTQQEQAKRTEQASSVLRNTTSKDRSYVTSAAKRHSGVDTQDSGSPFLAKRVEIQDEETNTNRKSHTLPKTLSTYLSEDAKRMEMSSNPRLTSYSMTSSSTVKPDAGKITVVREGSRNENKDVSKPPTDKESTTSVCTTRTERSSSPRMTNYSMTSTVDGRGSPVKPEAGKITVVREANRNEIKDVSKSRTDKESTTSVRATTERVDMRDKKDETPEKSLDSYLFEDASRFENKWKLNQPVQPTLQTPPARVSVREKNETPEKSLDSYLYEDANRFENKWKANQALQPTFQTSPARASDRPDSPKLTSWNTETRSSSIKPEPGKITVLREESGNINTEIPKLTSYSDNTETRPSSIQAGPGKITVLREERESPKVTTQVGSTTRTVETKVESTPPKPAPRGEKKPKDTSSNKQVDLISWTDLDETSDNRPTQSSRSGTDSTETRYRVSEALDDSEPIPSSNRITSNSGNGNVKISIETLSEQPKTTETLKTERTSSPRITPTSGNKNVKISVETLPEQPHTTVTPKTERSSSPRITPTSGNRNVKISVETLSEQPHTTATAETPRSSSPRITSTSENRNVRIAVETLPEQPHTTATPETERSSSPRITPTSGNRNVKISVETLPEQPHTTATPETERSSSPRITSTPGNRNVTISVETLPEQPHTSATPETQRSSSPRITSNSANGNVKISIETLSEQPKPTETLKTERSSSPRPSPRSRDSTTTTTVTETRYRVPETLEDTMLASSPSRSNSRTTVTTTRSTDPVYTEYLDDLDNKSTRSNSRTTVTTTRSTDPVYTEYLDDLDTKSTRTVFSSRESTTTTTVETRYDNSSSGETSQYDPQSSSNKGVLFVKEYVNTNERIKSPTTAGSLPDFSSDPEMLSYSTSSNYMYSSAPTRSDEGPCTYCGREIKDCPKIMLDHLNIHCHEYCFKCGICNKPMGDLMTSIFIHRQVIHCGSCYEKLF